MTGGREIYVDVPLNHKDPMTIGVNGERGENCKNLTARLEAAMGSVLSDTPTEEMFLEQSPAKLHVHEQQ